MMVGEMLSQVAFTIIRSATGQFEILCCLLILSFYVLAEQIMRDDGNFFNLE